MLRFSTAFFFACLLPFSARFLSPANNTCVGCIGTDLLSDVSRNWCNDNPSVRLFLEDDESEVELVQSFRSSIFTVTRAVNGVDFDGVSGGKESASYLFCNDGDRYACNVWDSGKHVSGASYFVEPPKEVKTAECSIKIVAKENLLLFTNFFSDNFGHFVHDNMPGMLFLYALREKMGTGRNAKLLVPSNPITKQFFEWVFKDHMDDLIFFDKQKKICIKHTASNNERIPELVTMHVKNAASIFDVRNPYFSTVATDTLRNMLSIADPGSDPNQCKEKYVIYYARNAVANMFHGRPVMNGDAVVASIEKMLRLHNRQEKVIVFDGEGYTIQQQYELFRCASVVVGGHGSGLGNAMWTQHSHKCSDPVHIIEVTCGPKSANVHSGGGCPYGRNYFQLTGGLPWAKYHLMTFTDNSTNSQTWIPLRTLEALLNDIFTPNDRLIKNGDESVYHGQTYKSFIEKGRYVKNSLEIFLGPTLNEPFGREKFSLVVYAPHKSGSMFIHNYFTDLSKLAHLSHFSENIGYPLPLDETFKNDKSMRKILAPFRVTWHVLPVVLLPTNPDSLVMIHWRDPRDVVISKYYSFGWSHVAPPEKDPGYAKFKAMREYTQSRTLDEYVLDNAGLINLTLTGMASFFSNPTVAKANIHVSHYDAMVFNFPKWHKDMCVFLKLSPEVCTSVQSSAMQHVHSTAEGKEKHALDVKHMSFNSSQKSSDAHFRDGSSNQYLKLQPETLEKLNVIIGPVYSLLKSQVSAYGVVI